MVQKVYAILPPKMVEKVPTHKRIAVLYIEVVKRIGEQDYFYQFKTVVFISPIKVNDWTIEQENELSSFDRFYTSTDLVTAVNDRYGHKKGLEELLRGAE